MVTDDLLLGGAARHVIDLSNELVLRGHTVTLAATDGPMRHSLSSGVTFLPLYLKNNRSMRNSIAGFIPSLFVLFKELRKGKYTILHSHKRFSHALCTLLRYASTAEHVTSFHSEINQRPRRTVIGTKVIGCSDSITASLARQFPRSREAIFTVRNGIRPFRIYSEPERLRLRHQWGITEDCFVIGSVGQFVPEKDRESFLRSISLMVKESGGSQFTVLIQGYGPMEDQLRSLSASLGLDQIVQFIPGDRSVELTCNVSDIMVLNSVSEGFPLILLEAASAGIPHVATRVGGIPEFVEHNKNGLLVPPGDIRALADAMKRLAADPALRRTLGEEARRTVLGSYSLSSMVDAVQKVYDMKERIL